MRTIALGVCPHACRVSLGDGQDPAPTRAAAVKSATLILEPAGFAPTAQQMDTLSRLLNR